MLLTTFVWSAMPFHCAIEPPIKPVPKIETATFPEPAAPMFGSILVTAGAGLFDEMLNVNGDETPPPGPALKTVTVAVPADAISAAVMVAWSWEPLFKTVGR